MMKKSKNPRIARNVTKEGTVGVQTGEEDGHDPVIDRDEMAQLMAMIDPAHTGRTAIGREIDAMTTTILTRDQGIATTKTVAVTTRIDEDIAITGIMVAETGSPIGTETLMGGVMTRQENR